MREWKGKKYWLIGASAGLGEALAHRMSRAGVDLVLSARSEDDLKRVAEAVPGHASVQVIDIADSESVAKAVDAVGDVDGVVFLAGVYWPFAAQDWDAEKAEAMANINFTGAMRVMGRVVPPMVARDSGHIVLTGSLSGFRGLPGAIGYSASKAGVMALAESMQCDLRKTGVDVQLVNPGFIRTRLTEKNDFKMPFIMEPEAAAQEVFEHMTSDDFKRSFPTLFSWVFRLSQFLPDWAYYRLFA